MIRQRRLSLEEHGRRGREMYHTQIEPHLGEDVRGKIVALDIDTGEYEVGDRPLEAADKLLARLPDAQIWCERVGYPAVYKHGGWPEGTKA